MIDILKVKISLSALIVHMSYYSSEKNPLLFTYIGPKDNVRLMILNGSYSGVLFYNLKEQTIYQISDTWQTLLNQRISNTVKNMALPC